MIGDSAGTRRSSRTPARADAYPAGAAAQGLAGGGLRRRRRRRGARDQVLHESDWTLRAYQQEAATRSGTAVRLVALPLCSARPLSCTARAQATTLSDLVTNTVSGRASGSRLRRTSLTEDEIGEYSGAKKEIKPVTIAQSRRSPCGRKGVYPHLEAARRQGRGLIVYDEVHLLPAPIFRMITATSSYGLTATLGEDGREGDVFSLIGPKRYDAP